MSRKPHQKSSETPTSNLRKATETCAKVLQAIDDHVELVVEQENVTDHDMRMVVHLSGLGRNVAQIGGELRKMESHEAKQEITTTQLVDYFRNKCTDEQRAQWSRDLLAMNRKASVLG